MNRENLLLAWRVFFRGKSRQRAVREFWLHLESELNALYHDLAGGDYKHGPYAHFTVNDTKKRDIYVARVRDRVAHQLVASYLEKCYQPSFIAHSFAAQKEKGVSSARKYIFDAIKNFKKRGQVWIGKMDVEKYFANINHEILLNLLGRQIRDAKILGLCAIIVKSFGSEGRGLPLGNLTSQWFANIYLHELDLYSKQTLGIWRYMRYNDDMVVISLKEAEVRKWVKAIVLFANERLRLTIPARKTEIISLPGGSVDVLGLCTDCFKRWIRPVTVKRAELMLAQKYECQSPELLDAVCSYIGGGIIKSVFPFP